MSSGTRSEAIGGQGRECGDLDREQESSSLQLSCRKAEDEYQDRARQEAEKDFQGPEVKTEFLQARDACSCFGHVADSAVWQSSRWLWQFWRGYEREGQGGLKELKFAGAKVVLVYGEGSGLERVVVERTENGTCTCTSPVADSAVRPDVRGDPDRFCGAWQIIFGSHEPVEDLCPGKEEDEDYRAEKYMQEQKLKASESVQGRLQDTLSRTSQESRHVGQQMAQSWFQKMVDQVRTAVPATVMVVWMVRTVCLRSSGRPTLQISVKDFQNGEIWFQTDRIRRCVSS